MKKFHNYEIDENGHVFKNNRKIYIGIYWKKEFNKTLQLEGKRPHERCQMTINGKRKHFYISRLKKMYKDL